MYLGVEAMRVVDPLPAEQKSGFLNLTVSAPLSICSGPVSFKVMFVCSQLNKSAAAVCLCCD